MSPFFVRIYIIMVATIAAILFMFLSFFLPEWSNLILGIQIILIPSIYIIGHEIIEYMTKEEYASTLEEINAYAQDLNKKYVEEKVLNKQLSREIIRVRRNAKK